MWSHRGQGLVVKVEDGEAQDGHEGGLVRLVPGDGGVVGHEEALRKGEEDDAGDEEERGDLRERAADGAAEDAEHRQLRREPACTPRMHWDCMAVAVCGVGWRVCRGGGREPAGGVGMPWGTVSAWLAFWGLCHWLRTRRR